MNTADIISLIGMFLSPGGEECWEEEKLLRTDIVSKYLVFYEYEFRKKYDFLISIWN